MAARERLDPVAFVLREAIDTDYATNNVDGTRHIVKANAKPFIQDVWRPLLSEVCGKMFLKIVKQNNGAWISGTMYDPRTGILEVKMETR